MTNTSAGRRFPAWMLVSLAAAFAVSAVLAFGGTSQAQEPGATDLTITKKVNRAKVNVGQTLTYRITVLNEGQHDARGVQVTDQLPSGVKFISVVNTRDLRYVVRVGRPSDATSAPSSPTPGSRSKSRFAP